MTLWQSRKTMQTGLKEAMLRAWSEHANSGGAVARSRIKVDYSDLAYEAVELNLLARI